MTNNERSLVRWQRPGRTAKNEAVGIGQDVGQRVSRRQMLRSSIAGATTAGFVFGAWNSVSHFATATSPSPNGFNHIDAEYGNQFYDYGSQKLMEIASATDIPELIEFRDSGEQETALAALSTSGSGRGDTVPLPPSRPSLGEGVAQNLETEIPIPLARKDNLIPQELDHLDSPSLPAPNLVLAAASADLGTSSRRITAPSDALSRRLGRSRRTLNIQAVNLGERININYFSNGRYDLGALAELDNIFRDRHSGKSKPIDPGVYDQLFAVSNIFQGREVNMLSGYRAPETNDAMRRRMAGVAKFSYHVRAQAVDFYIHGVSISEVHVASLKLTAGGVGYYPSSSFVHVDTGPLRNWPGRYANMGYRYRQA